MSYKISRRSFLKASAATAVAVAVAGATTGCSVAPFEPACTGFGDDPVKFGDFSITYFSSTVDDEDNTDGEYTVCFEVENNSNNDVTLYASDFRASCDNGKGELKAKAIDGTFLSSDRSKVVLKAKKSEFISVVFAGVKGKNKYPITLRMHRGIYTIKYIIRDAQAMVTPQPYIELVW